MKLHIRRRRGHWIVEQNGILIPGVWSRSFREICAIAKEWADNGWVVSKGWHGR